MDDVWQLRYEYGEHADAIFGTFGIFNTRSVRDPISDGRRVVLRVNDT
jgi:hypothetical protein